jgi:hypothetical protein
MTRNTLLEPANPTKNNYDLYIAECENAEKGINSLKNVLFHYQVAVSLVDRSEPNLSGMYISHQQPRLYERWYHVDGHFPTENLYMALITLAFDMAFDM